MKGLMKEFEEIDAFSEIPETELYKELKEKLEKGFLLLGGVALIFVVDLQFDPCLLGKGQNVVEEGDFRAAEFLGKPNAEIVGKRLFVRDLGNGDLLGKLRAVGVSSRAVQLPVVEQNKAEIPRGGNVQLDDVVSLFDCRHEGGHGVFGVFGADPFVCLIEHTFSFLVDKRIPLMLL